MNASTDALQEQSQSARSTNFPLTMTIEGSAGAARTRRNSLTPTTKIEITIGTPVRNLTPITVVITPTDAATMLPGSTVFEKHRCETCGDWISYIKDRDICLSCKPLEVQVYATITGLTKVDIHKALFNWLAHSTAPEQRTHAYWILRVMHSLSMKNIMKVLGNYTDQTIGFENTAVGQELEGVIHLKALDLGEEAVAIPQTQYWSKLDALAEYLYITAMRQYDLT